MNNPISDEHDYNGTHNDDLAASMSVVDFIAIVMLHGTLTRRPLALPDLDQAYCTADEMMALRERRALNKGVS